MGSFGSCCLDCAQMHLFLGNFRLFLSRFISVCTISRALVISVAQSIYSLLISIDDQSASRDWNDQLRQTNNLWSSGEKKKKKFSLSPKDFYEISPRQLSLNLYSKLWSGSWENILKKECNPQIMGWPCGWDTERMVDPSRKNIDWRTGISLVLSCDYFTPRFGYRHKKKGIVLPADEVRLREILVGRLQRHSKHIWMWVTHVWVVPGWISGMGPAGWRVYTIL